MTNFTRDVKFTLPGKQVIVFFGILTTLNQYFMLTSVVSKAQL
ncbi:MAG: hypothetical protein ACJAWS_001840 [Oleiphilaceae bacterium]|jgi:hypothetical protein